MLNLHTLTIAARALLRRPGFALLASLTLAIGVAGTTAVFALIDAVLLAPLPYPAANELVILGSNPQPWSALSPQMYQMLGEVPGVRSIGARFAARDVNISGSGDPELASAWPVDAGLLPTLGVQLELGRNFSAEEDRPNGATAAILSHKLWRRQFGEDRGVIGKSVQIDGVATTIVGVLPANFRLEGTPDLLLPLALAPNSQDSGTNLLAIARIDPAVSMATIGLELDARLKAGLRAANMSYTNLEMNFHAAPLSASFGAYAKPVLLLFLVCVGCVLLLVAVNLANLMLLRALARGHDSAVRSALGAGTAQLAAPALAEALWIGLAGALGGLALAWVALRLAQSWLALDWLQDVGTLIGIRSVALALAMGIAVALTASVFSIWRGRGSASARELAAGARLGSSVGSQRVARALVIVQGTLATLLLGASALLSHSLWNILQVDPGFNAEGVIVMRTSPSTALYPDTAALQAYSDRIVERLRRESGVQHAAVTTTLPVVGQLNLPVQGDNGEMLPGEPPQFRVVAGDALQTFGIALLGGRDFDARDSAGAEPVVIVNQAFAQQYFEGDALGQSIRNYLGVEMPMPLMRIVGVVGDVHQFGPMNDAPPTIYVPLAQVPDAVMGTLRQFVALNVAVRVADAPAPWFPRLRSMLREVDPGQGVADLRLLAHDLAESTAGMRQGTGFILLFGVLAIVLAAIGLYSVSAVAVASRRGEFGLRAALGAAPQRLLRRVLGTGLRDVSIGLGLGLIVLMLLGSMISGALYELSPFDPLALGVTLAVVLGAGLAASLVPGLRAARTAPMTALRSE